MIDHRNPLQMRIAVHKLHLFTHLFNNLIIKVLSTVLVPRELDRLDPALVDPPYILFHYILDKLPQR